MSVILISYCIGLIYIAFHSLAQVWLIEPRVKASSLEVVCSEDYIHLEYGCCGLNEDKIVEIKITVQVSKF
jgi:hypothetical protein